MGPGSFRAILYNHGSAMDSSAASDPLGPIFASHISIFFMPHRRGQGLSSSAGEHIRNQIAAGGKIGGISAAAATMIQLLATDHLSGQLAALDWLRARLAGEKR